MSNATTTTSPWLPRLGSGGHCRGAASLGSLIKALIVLSSISVLAGCGTPTDGALAGELQAILEQEGGKGDLGRGELCDAIAQPTHCNICDHVAVFAGIDERSGTALADIVVAHFCNNLEIALASGKVLIELYPDVAPNHVERIKTLVLRGDYDNVAFHRVIDDFIAQTGDVEHGDLTDGYDPWRVGGGRSDLPDLVAEFSSLAFDRGVVGMARTWHPHSANSQFFIMLAADHDLNGQHTVVGRVVDGMNHVEGLRRGAPPYSPDRMLAVRLVGE